MNQYWILKKGFGKKQEIKRKGKMKCLNVSVLHFVSNKNWRERVKKRERTESILSFIYTGDRDCPSSPDSQNNQNSANTPHTNGQSDSNESSHNHSGKLHKGGGVIRHKKNKSKNKHRYLLFRVFRTAIFNL